MATITIRNLDEKVKRRLQIRAARNGRSMEAEARAVLERLGDDGPANRFPEEDLGSAIHRLFAPLGGVELKIPPRRKSHRPIPTFD
jgi:antitoxin FitA